VYRVDQDKSDDFKREFFPMPIKTSIALVVLVAICSGALAAEKWQFDTQNAGPVLINRCVPDYTDPECSVARR
jgi:hypothetical protein